MISMKPMFGYLAYNGITLKELSEKSGVPYSTLCKMRHEATFSSKILDKLCTSLNLNIDRIMKYIPD